MIALDTRIVVRLLMNDDEIQARVAYRLIASHDVSVTLAVLMETEWVLRTVYRFSKSRILDAMKGLSGLERMTFDDPVGAETALRAFENGIDFSAAVHLAQARTARSFATFDKDVVKKAAKLTGLVPVFTPHVLER